MPDCTPHATEIVMADTPRRIAPAPKRAKRRPTSTLPPLPGVILEYGLEHRYAQDRVEVQRGIADPDDPNRTINRARATCSYERLAKRRAITEPHRQASEKYLTLREQESGGRWVNGENVASPSDSRPWELDGATVQQLAAVVALRNAHRALGSSARGIVSLLVVDNLHVAALAERFGRDEKVVMGEVRAALTRLCEYWGIEDQTQTADLIKPLR